MAEYTRQGSAQAPTLVLGGTGKTGRRVVERLTTRGVPTRVGSRAADPPFDWEDPATWAPALQGAGGAYISYYPDLAVPGASGGGAVLHRGRARARAPAAGAAVGSGRGGGPARRACRAGHGRRGDGRSVSWFNQNFSEGYLLEPILGGEVVLPAETQLEPFVDADDIADVAVAALSDDRHIGEVYELTSPRLMTFADAVAEIAQASGRDIRYLPSQWRTTPPAPPSTAYRPRSSASSPTCSATSYGHNTPSPTASSAPWDASRATSATSYATPPPPASGTRGSVT